MKGFFVLLLSIVNREFLFSKKFTINKFARGGEIVAHGCSFVFEKHIVNLERKEQRYVNEFRFRPDLGKYSPVNSPKHSISSSVF